jgi:uncharacterized membrane protein (UPF0127 family)
MLTFIRHTLFAGLLLLTASLSLAQSINSSLPIIELKTGIYRIQAEVASTPQARQVGLMNRTFMPTDSGMLFIFDQKATHCFWMSNTKIPLAIAFLGDDGKIVNIEEMQAETLNNHCPKVPVRYALEMNRQWFSQRAIGPGSQIQGLPRK